MAGLDLNMRYADFGAGTLGHFVFAASDFVGPQGQVYAVDILKSVLESIQSRARSEQVTNIITVWGDCEREHGVAIPETSLDVVSMVNFSPVGHQKTKVFSEAIRLLKPEGKVLVVDWKPGSESFGPSASTRPDQQKVQEEAKRAGLRFLKTFTAGPYHWGIIFQKS
jgi:ubiquinone/menaquinone biosynthesis C-methylase UbiE